MTQWLGGHYHPGDLVMVTLDEPLIEKTKSLKANASVAYLFQNDSSRLVSGKFIIYFKKDSVLRQINYGSQIIFKKPLQEIKNPGNPGGFDYKRYSLFQDITHQVYLQEDEFDKQDAIASLSGRSLWMAPILPGRQICGKKIVTHWVFPVIT